MPVGRQQLSFARHVVMADDDTDEVPAADRAGASRGPLDKALDLGIFAPLGLALEFHKVVPELAEAGRRQIAFSQSLGRAAIKAVLKSVDADANGAKRQPHARPGSVAKGGSGAETRAVAGYEQLTAPAVIAMLDDCDDETIEWIKAHETTNKQRVTVLRAITSRTRSS